MNNQCVSIEDQSWIDCIDITSRWDTFVSCHLYGNKEVSLLLWPIRPRWFHTFSPCAEPLGDGHEGMWARFGSQGSIALNWHSRYSGTRYSGTWLYMGCNYTRLVSRSSYLYIGNAYSMTSAHLYNDAALRSSRAWSKNARHIALAMEITHMLWNCTFHNVLTILT